MSPRHYRYDAKSVTKLRKTNERNEYFYFFFNYFILSYDLLFFEGDVCLSVFFDLVEEYGLFLTIKIGRDETMIIATEKNMMK